MRYRQLGNTDIKVSLICMGTMTFGQQNTQAEAFEQLDYAVAQGINFLDTAEVYAIPPKPETAGLTEEYIGNWMKSRGNRDKMIVATKVAGRSPNTWLRDGQPQTRLNAEQINYAVEGSLRRLQTDYIDLYQLHWPDRPMYLFVDSTVEYRHIPSDDDVLIEETLAVLGDLVKAGKIRHIGISNETAWGLHRYLQASALHHLPRVQTVQNAYNLMNRSYENSLAEFHFREQVGLLAYSPVAQGYLTGKYLNGQRPAGSRMELFNRMRRYETPFADASTQAYVDLAHEHGLDPAQMALAFVNEQPFLTSNIIGATSMVQLKNAIASEQLALSDEVKSGLAAIHSRYPNPCP
jgi:aryl-alcohol dehydrogenase-like predicted oxidoreductase